MKLKYTGRGEAFIGVPARDLTEEEVTTLSKDFNIQKMIDSGLYVEVSGESEAKTPPVKRGKKESEN